MLPMNPIRTDSEAAQQLSNGKPEFGRKLFPVPANSHLPADS